MSAKHYEKARITTQMVGMVLDLALLCHVAGTPAMGLQAAKKIIYTKRNSGKTRIQELREAIVAIEKMIEFEELDSMLAGGERVEFGADGHTVYSEQGFPEIETVGAKPEKYLAASRVGCDHGCVDCIFNGEDHNWEECGYSGVSGMANEITGEYCGYGFIYVLKDAE